MSGICMHSPARRDRVASKLRWLASFTSFPSVAFVRACVLPDVHKLHGSLPACVTQVIVSYALTTEHCRREFLNYACMLSTWKQKAAKTAKSCRAWRDNLLGLRRLFRR